MISPDQNSGGFLFFLLICGFFAWLFALVSLLKRQDLKEADKIIWVIVLCVLNILGMLLYWFIAPDKPGVRSAAMSDKELKEYFNKRGGRPERNE